MKQHADTATIAHVLNRVAYGPRRRDWEKAEELGGEGYVRWQLEPERIDDTEANETLHGLPTLTMDIGELYREYPPPQVVERLMRQDEELDEEARRRLAQQSRIPLQELGAARMFRAVESRRQLNEVLVDFWFNHFNVFAGKGQVRYLLSTYERDVIRPHVLGSFRQMLGAVAHSPAMLVYLDNWQSAAEEGRDVAGAAPRARNDAVEDAIRRMRVSGGRVDPRRMQQLQRQSQQRRRGNRPPGLNENYARELLELHTMGVDGGYSQDDVREVARALTGWTLTLGGRSPDGPGFVFRPDWHDAEAKTILGQEFPGGRGIEDGEAVLDMVAAHPSTASFVATKLCRKFVADDPPGDLVDTVAGTFLRTSGNLRATTTAVLLSDEFLGSDYRAAKVKSPLEFLVSAARALEVPVGTNGQLGRALRQLGAPLYSASPPTGYPDTAEEWTSANAILARMETGSLLSTAAFSSGALRGARRGPGAGGGQRPDAATARAGRTGAAGRGPQGTVEERSLALLAQLLPGGVSGATRDKIVSWGMTQEQTPSNAEISTLILGSPEFQRR